MYVSAGRSHGDNVVSVFRLGGDGRLALVEEFVDGAGGFHGFKGGNELVVSPDGLNVYAAGTTSRSVACFSRDPATGRLTFLESVADGGQGGGNGARGRDRVQDGQFPFVATEDGKTGSVFRRRGAPVLQTMNLTS